MLTKISSALDAIADRLEKKGLVKEAFELDKIADELDNASTKIAGREDGEYYNRLRGPGSGDPPPYYTQLDTMEMQKQRSKNLFEILGRYPSWPETKDYESIARSYVLKKLKEQGKPIPKELAPFENHWEYLHKPLKDLI